MRFAAWRAWLQRKARAVKRDLDALVSALTDTRTPWTARLVIAVVAAYAVSPIDLIPDFIPVIGLVDDLVLVPAGLALAIRLIPPDVLAEHRVRASSTPPPGWLVVLGAVAVLTLWLGLAFGVYLLLS